MAEINLLNTDSAQSHSLAAKSKKWLMRVVSLIFVGVLVYYGFLFLSGQNAEKDLEEAKNTVTSYQNEINESSRRQELITRQGQLNQVNKLVDAHLAWSQLLPELARVSLTSARYTNIEAKEDGQLDVTVELSSYADADKYLQVFNLPQFNSSFSNVTIMALTRSQDEEGSKVSMRLRLEFDQELLK